MAVRANQALAFDGMLTFGARMATFGTAKFMGLREGKKAKSSPQISSISKQWPLGAPIRLCVELHPTVGGGFKYHGRDIGKLSDDHPMRRCRVRPCRFRSLYRATATTVISQG